MLSATSRYALSALRYLAERPTGRFQAVQIARDTGIPANYLSKVLNQLRKQGFVSGQKGWGGGFQFSPEAVHRPLIEIIQLFDGQKVQTQCLLAVKSCDESNPCPLHESWSRIQKGYQDTLARLTVRDIADKQVPAERPTSFGASEFLD